MEINPEDGLGTCLVDPMAELAAQLGSPDDLRSYHHDGDMKFILGIADPAGNQAHLQQRVKFPPPGAGTPRAPLLHVETETLIRALRDAEVLAAGPVAASQVRRRIDVY